MLTDADGVSHKFNFALRLLGDRVAVDAHEILDDPDGGYESRVLSFELEGEPLVLFRERFEKMRRALAQKHLQQGDQFGTRFTESGLVRGNASCNLDSDASGRLPMLVIDGKSIIWEQFGEMRMTYEGFFFKLEVYDRSEERSRRRRQRIHCPGSQSPAWKAAIGVSAPQRHHMWVRAAACPRSLLGGLHHEYSLAHPLA